MAGRGAGNPKHADESGAVKSEGVDQVGASLAWPVGIDGLTAGVQISRLNYEVVEGDQVALDPEGTSQSSAITLRYPLIRARNQNLYLSAEISRADYRNEASGAVTSDYQVQSTQLGLSGNQFATKWLAGSVQGGVTLTEGESDRAGSDDHFWILGANLNYTQQVEATDRISLRWRTRARIRRWIRHSESAWAVPAACGPILRVKAAVTMCISFRLNFSGP